MTTDNPHQPRRTDKYVSPVCAEELARIVDEVRDDVRATWLRSVVVTGTWVVVVGYCLKLAVVG